MPKQHHIGDLELQDELRFHRLQWTFERAGWIALGIFLLLAFTGVLGMGPLSHARAASQDATLTVEYDRFARRQAPSSLTLHFSADSVQEGRLRFWVARDYLDRLGVEQIVPQPASTQVAGDRIYYDFNVEPAEGDIAVTFELQPEGTARLEGSAGVDGGGEVHYWQLIYP